MIILGNKKTHKRINEKHKVGQLLQCDFQQREEVKEPKLTFKIKKWRL